MTEDPREKTPPVVVALTFGGIVMLVLSMVIGMGYIPSIDESVRRTVAAVVFVAGLIDLGMALFFLNRSLC